VELAQIPLRPALCNQETPMNDFRSHASAALLVAGALWPQLSSAADLIVSANDGKYVRVEGVSTYPQPAPSDSLAVIDASQFPPKITAVVEGVEHTRLAEFDPVLGCLGVRLGLSNSAKVGDVGHG
jgi:hypothetical protein